MTISDDITLTSATKAEVQRTNRLLTEIGWAMVVYLGAYKRCSGEPLGDYDWEFPGGKVCWAGGDAAIIDGVIQYWEIVAEREEDDGTGRDAHLITMSWGDELIMRADWSQAGASIYIDGEDTGRQVADFCHDPERAAEEILEDWPDYMEGGRIDSITRL